MLPHVNTHRHIHTLHTSRQPTVPSADSCVLPHASTHTDTRTHTTRRPCSSVLSSVASPCCSSHESSRPIVFQPLSPVVHASLIHLRRTLLSTPFPRVSYVSTLGSSTNTNLFTFLPDAQTPGCRPPTLHIEKNHWPLWEKALPIKYLIRLVLNQSGVPPQHLTQSPHTYSVSYGT